MLRKVSLKTTSGKTYTYDEANLQALKAGLEALIDEYNRKLWELLGWGRGGEPLEGSDANKLQKAADTILAELRKKLEEGIKESLSK